MINSISMNSSISGLQEFQPNFAASKLSESQKSTISDILSEYDPENITEEDAKEIWQSFQNAGIQPQAGLKEVIETNGFDAEDIRVKATGEKTPPPPPASGAFGSNRSSTINTSALSTLKDILSNYDLDNLSSDDQDDLLNQIYNAGLTDIGSLIDLKS